MKTFFKILIGIGGLLILLFTQCRRKPKSPNITDWLEKEYPNRFEVLDTYTRDVIRHLSFSAKGSIVAEKSNPLVQANLRWDKRVEDLELSKAIVDSAFLKAHREYNDAQSLYKTIEANDLKDMAVSIKNGTAMVLIFAEPTPEHRQNSLKVLEKCFIQWQKEADYDINISYLEPSEKDKAFKEIVPLIYWSQSSAEFRGNMLYWTTCPIYERFFAKEAAKAWQFNTSSNRFLSSIENARKEAEHWATEHIKRPITMFQTAEFEHFRDNAGLVAIKFPFAYQSDKEEKTTDYITANGYIKMDFHVEKKIIIGQIKLINE
jgi:hypothetical protein